MTDLPTGTVTFLFTDLQGSTRLLQELGDAYSDLLDEHHRIVRGAIEAAGGIRVSTEGDGVFGVFVSPVEAVTAAASAQLGLAHQSWPYEVEVRVRMGIHTGEGVIGPEGYVGLDVHRAARISSVSHGGQVVISNATRSLVEQSLPVDLRLLDLGLHRLKDLAGTENIYQLLITGLPGEFPPLRSLDAVRNNLPLQLTSFVGRGAELAEMDELLRASRLVTLTGVGGTGKTRLAYQLAADASHAFPDGVWVAELASLTDPDLVANELATEMGLRPQPGESIGQTLVSVIGQQTVLVILDNCEHLLDAVAELASDLLHSGPGVTVIATSREALGVTGEVSYPVASLKTPRNETVGPDEVLGYDAAELFVERAALARPGFVLTDKNVEAVVQICRRLDGVPLAIELAAARVRSLSPDDIAVRLDDRFRLLTGGSRTSVPRHRTLEATVAWSYDSLSETEKQVFARLSVFSGGFTLDSAERVCEGDGVEALDVVDVVLGLVEKSLVTMDQHETGTRYRLLETLRQYAYDRLIEQSDPVHFRHQHAEAFAELGERTAPALRSLEQIGAFQQLEAEHDNFRAALTWAHEAPEPLLVLRLVAALARFWLEAGYWTEGRFWLSSAAIRDEALPPDLQIEATLGAQDMTLSEDLMKNVVLSEKALERAHQLDDQALLGRAMAAHGLSVAWIGKIDEATEMLETAVQICRDGIDQWALADALKCLGNVLAHTKPEESEAALLESLEIFRGLGDRLKAAEVLHQAGGNARDADRDNAREWLTESLELYRELGSRSGEGHALLALGGLQRSLGEDAAFQTLTEALHVLMDVGDQNCAAGTERGVALLEIGKNPASAAGRLRTALTMSARVGNRFTMALTMDALGKLSVQADEHERAVSLFGAAELLLVASGRTRTRSAKADRQPEFDLAKTRLDEVAYQAAWDAGAAMTEDESVEFALRQPWST